MRRTAVIFGTRPEAIKMAPIIQELRRRDGEEPVVVLTAQHRGLLDPMLDVFGLRADHDLDIFAPGQSLDAILAKAVLGIGTVLADELPDLVLVQGDTTTTLAGALAGLHAHVPVGHVEAGLRTGDLFSPFPEEGNRRAVTHLSSLHFPPTEQSAGNLVREGIDPARTFVTGNTVIDALLWCREHAGPTDEVVLDLQADPRRKVLVTLHRRESWGAPMVAVAEAIAEVVAERDDLVVLFPIHRNPIVRQAVRPILAPLDAVRIVEPLPYPDFVHAMAGADLILSDSGGVQEEAPTFGVPNLVLRDETERPDALQAGAVLVGTNRARVAAAMRAALDEPGPPPRANPFGDGGAAARVVDAIAHHFDGAPRPAPFADPLASPA